MPEIPAPMIKTSLYSGSWELTGSAS